MTAKRPKGRPFQPGKSGNPLGAALHNPALKAIRRLTNAEVAEVGTLLLENNLDALQSMKDDKNVSVLKAMLASVVIKTIKKGDHQALNVLLDRIAGKVKQSVEVAGVPGGAPITTASLSPKERMSLIKDLDKVLKLTEDE